MTPDQFTQLQTQLWMVISPLVPWLIALFIAGGVSMTTLIISLIFMREWTDSVGL